MWMYLVAGYFAGTASTVGLFLITLKWAREQQQMAVEEQQIWETQKETANANGPSL